MLDHVAAGRMTLERFVDMTSAGPARLFGIARKGRTAVGFDADFTIVDLSARKPSAIPGSPALRLDAPRRKERYGLAGRNDRARPG